MLDPVTANFLGDNLRCWMQIQVKVTDDGIKLPGRTKTRASHDDILLILLTSLMITLSIRLASLRCSL